MRILKLFLISFSIFFLLLTAVGLLFPSVVRVSRAIDLPGQRRSFLMEQMAQPGFQKCWSDSAEMSIVYLKQGDSSVIFEAQNGIQLRWNFHEANGVLTVQGQVEGRFGWLPWQRFRSLLLEPRYGLWLEQQLEKLKNCVERTQVVSVSP